MLPRPAARVQQYVTAVVGLALRVGAGLALLALPATALRAQNPPPRPPPRDTVRADTVRVRGDTGITAIPQTPDSVRMPNDTTQPAVRADSTKAPIARFESPVTPDIGLRYAWDREAFFASGAITLTDLLERVPGLTTLRAGWIAAPATASYLGQTGRIRVFMDGIEIDPQTPREGHVLDLGAIQLWQLEDVVVERGASEVRVWVRSWRHDRTTPHTRVDVTTGDEETNAYRGFYAKRYGNGMALQVGAQQWSTSASPRSGGAGDLLSLVTRVGWARGGWSVDGFLQQSRRSADAVQDGTRGGDGRVLLTGVEVRDRLAYLRAGWGVAERDPFWVQLVASTRRVSESGERIDSASSANLGLPLDVSDTIDSRAQYVAAAGLGRGGARLSVSLRARAYDGALALSPLARLSVDRRWLTATLLAERLELPRDENEDAPGDSAVTRFEGLLRVSPLSFVSFAGAATLEEGYDRGIGQGENRDRTGVALRGEAAIRIGQTWFSGGVLARDAVRLPSLQLLSAYPTDQGVAGGEATGSFAAVRGNLWKGFGIDAHGVRWNDADAFYRPQWQSRGELYFRTNWLRRFPSGEFGFLVAATHEYRSTVRFALPERTGSGAGATAPTVVRTAPQSRTVGTLVELRLQQAVISWQYRNLAGERFEWVPRFAAPRPINFYGVRWEFWN